MGNQSEKYLYGAAVQGIQEFIYQTNKLREILGASELVEEICTTMFANTLYGKEHTYAEARKALMEDNNAILFAAGNVKYIFQSREACEQFVRIFPKVITSFAPGITISQAVVKMEGENATFATAVNLLENRLRTQRNRPLRSPVIGMMGIMRSRQTGLPVIDYPPKNNTYWDAAKLAKLKIINQLNNEPPEERQPLPALCQKSFGIEEVSDRRIAYEIEDITQKNDWIAIIHADGNGLGQIVQKIGANPEKFKQFSLLLDEATIASAVHAYNVVSEMFGETKVIPIRPVVLSGDDLTMICRADLALAYTKAFIEEFEKQTEDKLGSILRDNQVFTNDTCYLTACAGITYIKSSFPFYAAYNLAEELCSVAKKDAKAGINAGELPKSCISFHKVQDSFTEDWKTIVKRELSPQAHISFAFGPYYVTAKKNDSQWSVDDLLTYTAQLGSKEGNAVKSHLRQWMSFLHDNPAMAQQKLDRLKSITTKKELVEAVTKSTERDGKNVYPVYDILAIHTINNQQTK